MRKKFQVSLFLAIIVILNLAAPVSADGIIIPEPPIHPPTPDYDPMVQLSIRYHHVQVEIENQIAVTHVDQVFHNPNNWPVEGKYIFPLPIGATVTNFVLWIDGEAVEGEVLPADEARQVYEEIVFQLQDPALLEYIGQGAFQASIFPIPPDGESRIELEYRQTLTAENGLIQYTYPLNTEKFSFTPLESVSVSLEIKSDEDIRAVYSPSHPLDIVRQTDKSMLASYEASNTTPNKDFELHYSIGKAEALHLYTYCNPDDIYNTDGYFMLLLAPPVQASNDQIAKDIILVLDRSGSMEGEKFQQAQTALKYILQHLQSEDRFYLSTFSTSISEFSSELMPSRKASEAIKWAEELYAGGSTNIDLALSSAARVVDKERPTYLIFLTDGLPTEGIVDSEIILQNFSQSASNNIRLFSFGVGYDVDTYLLDSLSSEHHGLTTYVQPGEALDESLSAFYEKISTPLMTNLSLDFEGLTTYDVYPNPMPDLFSGSQIVVMGRYKNGGQTDILLSGDVENQRKKILFEDLDFESNNHAESQMNDNLPRLWATRKIGYLLKQTRINGANQETIDQIVKLSIRYGIVTPYTSYLVTEPMPLGETSQRELAEEEYENIMATPAAVSGQAAVEKAAEEAQLADSAYVPEYESQDGEIRNVWTRSFILREDIWIDTAYDPDSMQPLPVQFLSENYFELINYSTDIRAALALGENVILIINNDAYEIISEKIDNAAPLKLESRSNGSENQSETASVSNEQEHSELEITTENSPNSISETKNEEVYTSKISTVLLLAITVSIAILSIIAYLVYRLNKSS